MRVLVTNGDTRPALAITRSLGSLGHEVIVAAERHPSLASASRYCSGREQYPSLDLAPRAFAETIAAIAVRRRTDLLLPVNEIATTLIAGNRHLLPAHCVLPLPSNESLAIANDKSKVLAYARELDIPVPRTVVLDCEQDFTDAVQPGFPVVIKPARSRVMTATGWHSAGVDYAVGADQLRARLRRISPDLYPVMLQERIVGPGIGVFACFQHGQPIAFFSHRRLREKPPSGGVSVLSESTKPDAQAQGFAMQLLSRLQWHGVAMVEFKRDTRDGSLRLMEINGRFWGSLQLAIDSGVDFPALVARMAAGEQLGPPARYRIGVRTRWFLGDLDALLAILSRSAARLNLPADHPGRWHTLWEVLGPQQRGQRSEIMRSGDHGPGWLEIRQWLGGS